MVRSMTGFGKGVCEYQGSTVTVEISSVNHRFLDAGLRIPHEWSALESVLREIAKDYLSRGKVNISIIRKRGTGQEAALKLNQDVARQYLDASSDLAQLMGRDESLSIDTLAQFPGVFTMEEDAEDLDKVREVVEGALREGLENLNAMRLAEGEKLAADLTLRMDEIERTVGEVEQRLPELRELYAAKLRTRIDELNVDTNISEDRIALELAVLAEKGDVTEEIVRLRSHLEHANEMMESGDAVGRKLNFLVQELQREINTLGSKVRDTDVVRNVLHMKSELEKFREQIQNIE
ncbi:MAG: YicC family protein [Candidatus Hydrogenedentota bacterium]|nr:MAG: YicC family protein [Candidatus Hydrogenedentota bacterium]